VYDFFKDQGSLIAGVLALAAGGWAYWAAREQIAAAQQIERQRIARERLAAVWLMESVLTGLNDDLEQGIMNVGSGVEVAQSSDGQDVDAALATKIRNRIRKLDMAVVWNQLGHLDPSFIRPYMALDREVLQLWAKEATRNPTRNEMLGELRILQGKVRSLWATLDVEARASSLMLRPQPVGWRALWWKLRRSPTGNAAA
jgi:hypothetical protein